MSASIIPVGVSELDIRALLAPDFELWERLDATSIPLVPTPLESQPSAYVQTSWQDRQRGDLPNVGVRALRNRDTVAIQLTWHQSGPQRSINDYNVFADACAVLFPENGAEADLETMGSPSAPVVGWYWRAGTAQPFEITAKGIGTVERSKDHGVQCAARWAGDHWHVALARNLDLPHPAFELPAEIPVAFAVWCGARGERAGLKSHSPEFHRLRLTS